MTALTLLIFLALSAVFGAIGAWWSVPPSGPPVVDPYAWLTLFVYWVAMSNFIYLVLLFTRVNNALDYAPIAIVVSCLSILLLSMIQARLSAFVAFPLAAVGVLATIKIQRTMQ